MWSPTISSDDVLRHSQGPWKDHKYVKVVDGKYYYPNSYKDGRTISDLKGSKLKDDDVNKIADETIKGEHGNGNARKEKFGKDWARIQNKVNEKLGNKKRHKEDEEDDDEEVKKEESKDANDSKENSKKKKKGSSSKKKSSSSSKKKSSSSKKGSSSKGSGGSKGSNGSTKKSKADEILKKRREQQRQREKERRMALNRAYGREYLNHSIWAPTPSSDELWHHGIDGQKWGVRNGPPYPLDSSDYSSAERKYRTDKGYHKNQNGIKSHKKKVSEMSNEELQRRINRKQLEQRYNELNDAQISRGKNKVVQLVRDYSTVAAAVGSTVGTAYTIYKWKNKIIK